MPAAATRSSERCALPAAAPHEALHWNVTSRELNIIGQRAEEACAAVDKFLDNAAMASVSRVRIVHGHGMGVLRKAVAEMLAGHPHVQKFYPAEQNEGGTGATIAELKGD